MLDAIIAALDSFYKYCLEVKWRVLGAVVLMVVTVGLAVVWAERTKIVCAFTSSPAIECMPSSAPK